MNQKVKNPQNHKCVSCRKVKKHYAKGLCESCYKNPRSREFQRKNPEYIKNYFKTNKEQYEKLKKRISLRTEERKKEDSEFAEKRREAVRLIMNEKRKKAKKAGVCTRCFHYKAVKDNTECRKCKEYHKIKIEKVIQNEKSNIQITR